MLAVRAIKPEFDGLRMDVQNAAFLNMGATMQHLAGVYIPVLRGGPTGQGGLNPSLSRTQDGSRFASSNLTDTRARS